MRLVQVFIFLFLLGIHPLARSNSTDELHKLLNAMRSSDMSEFRELLANGVDPNLPTEHGWFRFTSSCESTKEGNSEYFEAIVESGANLHLVSPLGGFSDSMIACAIQYNNFDAYRRLHELGVDINSVQNPGAEDSRLYLTPFHLAVMSNRFKIAADILDKIDPSQSQISTLNRIIQRTSGYKGHKEQSYRNQLRDWLRNKGY